MWQELNCQCLLDEYERRTAEEVLSPKRINTIFFVMVMHCIFYVAHTGCNDERPMSILVKVCVMVIN